MDTPATRHIVDGRIRFVISTVLADLGTFVLAAVTASLLEFRAPVPWMGSLLPDQNIRPLLLLIGAAVVIGSWGTLRMVHQGVPRPTYARAAVTAGFTLAVASVGTVLTRTYYSRAFLFVTVGVWFLGALAHRAYRRRRPWVESLVLVTGEKQLVNDLSDSPHVGDVEVLDPHGEAPRAPWREGSVLVVDLRSVLSESMAQYVSSVSLAGYPVRSLVTMYEEHTGRVALVHLAEGWEVSAPLARKAPYEPYKRFIEFGLVFLTSPLWVFLAAVTAAAIRLDSPGSVVFRQRRVGLDGRHFTLYKFRTMIDGADDDGPQFTAVDDERITGVGRILRKTRLDEIPQLLNVLKGDMALVGPRAEQPEFVEAFAERIPFYGYRHLVRPGITGWAQVNAGYADDLEDTIIKLSYDLYYLRHMSPTLDAAILWRSVWTVISGDGAQ